MNIGVFFGSRSPEHDVSIITGQLVISGLKKLGHNVVPVYLSKSGDWCIGDELSSIEFFKDANFETNLKKVSGYLLDLEFSKEKLIFKKQGTFGSKSVEIDLAFPSFHGQNGEDGTIQGLFELANIPYIGCDVLTSALTMDKVFTKMIYERLGLPTAKFTHFSKNEWIKESKSIMEKCTEQIQFPVIVKPASLGSSIGISKAENLQELEFGIEVALHYDSKIIVEECIQNLADLTVAIMGNESPKASLIQESVFEGQVFSYEEKYLKEGGAQLGNAEKSIHIPARISSKKSSEIQEMACIVFKAFGCSGIARVDFLYDKSSEQYYVNEINTMPGTLYHHLWKKSGVSLDELLINLIELSKQKHKEKNKLSRTFDSKILMRAGDTSIKLKGA